MHVHRNVRAGGGVAAISEKNIKAARQTEARLMAARSAAGARGGATLRVLLLLLCGSRNAALLPPPRTLPRRVWAGAAVLPSCSQGSRRVRLMALPPALSLVHMRVHRSFPRLGRGRPSPALRVQDAYTRPRAATYDLRPGAPVRTAGRRAPGGPARRTCSCPSLCFWSTGCRPRLGLARYAHAAGAAPHAVLSPMHIRRAADSSLPPPKRQRLPATPSLAGRHRPLTDRMMARPDSPCATRRHR